MGLAFKTVGTYGTGGAPETDPNVGGPLAARILELQDRNEQGERSNGVRAYYELTGGVGTPTLDVTVWVVDETTGNWAKAIELTGLVEFEAIQVANVAPGRIFFQVVAESGTFTSAEFFAAPL